MWLWTRAKNPLRVIYNFLLISFARYVPSLTLRIWLLRATGMRVAPNVGVGMLAMFDFFFPELITLEENCLIGYNATILCHEFLPEEYRIGPVVIGKNALISANTTVLAGVRVGPNTIVSAASLVNRDLPPNVLAGGVPARVIRRRMFPATGN
jgi:acetyltransferase-like isoleucine patch superfamily enzyme